MELPTYSIVIPAYNESARISATLEKIASYVAEKRWHVEVIVVDDGSRDATVEMVRQLMGKYGMVRLLENPGNRGKGYSVRNGMLHASGEILLFSDADLASPIEEAQHLFRALADGADVAIGSRWVRAELQTRRQPLYRQIMGRIFNLVQRLFLGLRFKDTQCGFKAFTRKAAQSIFPLQRTERWGFDPELLFLARKFGFKVQEVPVGWAHREGTKLNPILDGVRMFMDVARIRWNSLTGKYHQPRSM